MVRASAKRTVPYKTNVHQLSYHFYGFVIENEIKRKYVNNSRLRSTIPHINSETNPSSPHDQCCLQVSETVSGHKLRCCYSSNILQHCVGGGA